MKLNVTKSQLYGFTAGLAVLGLLALPVVGAPGLKGGSVSIASIGDETDWTLASTEGTSEEEVDWSLASKDGTSEEEPDWTLAENKVEDVEPDWTLASNDESHEEEIDWTLA